MRTKRDWRIGVALALIALVCVGILTLPGYAFATAPPTSWTYSCDSTDVNYQLCRVVIERDNYFASEVANVDDSTAGAISRLDLVWIMVAFTGGTAFGVTWGRILWNELKKWHGARSGV